MLRFTQKTFCATVVGTAAVLALSACEFRQTDAPEDPGNDDAANPELAVPPSDPLASPEPAQSPVASIIRSDVEADTTPPEPPSPVEVVLPFPDSADLTPRAERMLETALASEAMVEGWPVVLMGHTDSSGYDQANLRAARSRAETVAAWLVERGVADERITVIAFGEQNPIAPNARPDGTPNEEGRRTNRRVELRIAPKDAAQPDAAMPLDATTDVPARDGA